MPKYRKKPIVIEAEQWFPGKKVEGVINFTDEPSPYSKVHENDYSGYWLEPYGVIKTLEGKMKVSPGDWIITGVNGEKYPCKPDIFDKTYEMLETWLDR